MPTPYCHPAPHATGLHAAGEETFSKDRPVNTDNHIRRGTINQRLLIVTEMLVSKIKHIRNKSITVLLADRTLNVHREPVVPDTQRHDHIVIREPKVSTAVVARRIVTTAVRVITDTRIGRVVTRTLLREIVKLHATLAASRWDFPNMVDHMPEPVPLQHVALVVDPHIAKLHARIILLGIKGGYVDRHVRQDTRHLRGILPRARKVIVVHSLNGFRHIGVDSVTNAQRRSPCFEA
jgi:hypothetical protein